MHPLSGSNLATLVRVIWENGGVSPRRMPQAATAVAAALGRWPLSAAEKVVVARRLRRAGPMPAPVFVVGHWRSGTTHLYNILSKGGFGYVSPLAAGLPWDLLGLVALCRPMLERALPRDRYIDSIPVKPDSPQEDEVALANMTPLSFYHGLYFPRNFGRNFNRGVFLDGCSAEEIAAWQRAFVYFLHKVWLDQDQRRLVIKNPVYTARIAMIRQIFPDARFIHVYRNPYEVFRSMQNFFEKLLEQFALQDYDGLAIDELILATYDRMMQAVIADSDGLPEDVFVEIRYEDLERDPIAELARVYGSLDLGAFAAVRPEYERYLAGIAGYRKNRFAYTDDMLAKVEGRWGAFLERWGYGRPDVALAPA
ncbi:MAG: sulfotransferase [Rhodospirillales bacterium]|nr:MAG: sulfotransferase [Rhodospirillales bacterium]